MSRLRPTIKRGPARRRRGPLTGGALFVGAAAGAVIGLRRRHADTPPFDVASEPRPDKPELSIAPADYPLHAWLEQVIWTFAETLEAQRRQLQAWRSAGEPIDAGADALRDANESLVRVGGDLEQFFYAHHDELVAEYSHAKTIGPRTLERVVDIARSLGDVRTFLAERGIGREYGVRVEVD